MPNTKNVFLEKFLNAFDERYNESSILEKSLIFDKAFPDWLKAIGISGIGKKEQLQLLERVGLEDIMLFAYLQGLDDCIVLNSADDPPLKHKKY